MKSLPQWPDAGMDFQYTSEQQLVRQTMREFAETEVAPIAAKMDEEDWWCDTLVPRMALPEKVGALAGRDVEEMLKTSLAYKLTRG